MSPMNITVVKFSLCVICVLFAGTFCAFGTDKIAKSAAVSVKCVHAPLAKTSGTTGSATLSTRDQWVEVDLHFNTNDIKELKKRFIDSPELEVQIVSYYSDGKSKLKPVEFTGKINYWTLEMDGREHYMKALLPPVLARRYTFETSVSKVIWLARVVLKAGGRNLCIAYGSSKPIADNVIYSYFRENLKNAVKVENAVSGRAGTSWSVIEVNKYELEKK